MSHLRIIELSPTPIKEKDSCFDVNDLIEDPLFLARCDYGGDRVKYKNMIDVFAKEIRPVAFVNKRKRTITFKSVKSVKKRYLHNITRTVRQLSSFLRTGEGEIRSDYSLHSNIDDVCGCDNMFFSDNYLHTLSSIVMEYINGYMPKTVYIGRVLDGHY